MVDNNGESHARRYTSPSCTSQRGEMIDTPAAAKLAPTRRTEPMFPGTLGATRIMVVLSLRVVAGREDPAVE
jgi:hypothetical protein